MRIFRQGQGPYALPLAVIGIRLGQRLLDVGADEARLFAELAGKVGLTGQACAVVSSEAAAGRVTTAAAKAGVLAEVEVLAEQVLPFPANHFDVALLDDTAGFLATADDQRRTALAAEVLRTLRAGGRALVLEREPVGLLGTMRGWLSPGTRLPSGGASALLRAGGFHPVRLLAEREGQRFTEGWKTATIPAPSNG